MSRPRDAGGSGLHRIHSRTGAWQADPRRPAEDPTRSRPESHEHPTGSQRSAHSEHSEWSDGSQRGARSERVPPGAAEHAREPEANLHAECYACPVGSMFASARGVEPETLDRLLGAVHELLSLTRSFVDAVDKAVEAQRAARGRTAPRVRRIVVD